MQNDKNKSPGLPPFPRIELNCATSGVKVTLLIIAVAWSTLLICLYSIPTPDVALWISLGAYALLLNPRKVTVEGEWLYVHWLAWKKSFHLSALEGVFIRERLDVTDVVACFRDTQPVAMPFWRRFPGSHDDDRFRVAAHLSRLASNNAEKEVSSYERGGVSLSMHHNNLLRAIGLMAAGIIFSAGTIAYLLYRNDWKATPDLFWISPAVLFAMGCGINFVILFLRAGAHITATGARRLTRLGPEEGETKAAYAEFSAGNFNGVAVAPRLTLVVKGEEGRRVEMSGDYSSFFLALRLFQKWPVDSFKLHVHPFQPKNAEDADTRLTREFRKSMQKLVFRLKRDGGTAPEGKGRVLAVRGEPLHALASRHELFDSVEEMLGLV